jgi:predicted RNA-binding Zn-ribbon protein involved in translation (DUF1610 family)
MDWVLVNLVLSTMQLGRKTRIIRVYCANCGYLLYKYRKAGPGHLVKCYKDRITTDYTRGDLKCPQCGQEFAREKMIHGKPANKIIQGKVLVRR